jgi:hypothetical protein
LTVFPAHFASIKAFHPSAPCLSSSRSRTNCFQPIRPAFELLVERVDLQLDAIDLRLRIEGLTSLLNELSGNTASRQAAA